MITFQTLETFLDEKRLELRSVVNSFTEKQLNWRKDEYSWTVPEIVEHLYLTESLIVYQVRKLIKSFPPQPSEPLQMKDVDTLHLFQAKGLLGVKRKAPSLVEPTNGFTLEEGLKKLEEIRQKLKSFLPELEQRETNTMIARLNELNVEMNVCQWVHFAAVHEWGHIHQLRRMVEESKTE